jgi:serine/threonine protein phosphatase PrpC
VSLSLFGVFDGHGGPRTAICAAYAFSKGATGKDLTAEWLKFAFHEVDELVRGLASAMGRLPSSRSGGAAAL